MSLNVTILTLWARGSAITPGHTGVSAPDIKTHLTSVDPVDFINSLDTPRRVSHGYQLSEIFNRGTGVEPKIWGPTMIGYGEVHYTSCTDREGDWFCLGFSPRKAKISLYGLNGDKHLLAQSGRPTRSAGCVYITKLEAVDLKQWKHKHASRADEVQKFLSQISFKFRPGAENRFNISPVM